MTSDWNFTSAHVASRKPRALALAGAVMVGLVAVAPETALAQERGDVAAALGAMTNAAGASLNVARSPGTGLATFISAPAGSSIPVPDQRAVTPAERALSFVEAYGGAFGLRSRDGVSIERVQTDELGVDHVRMRQVISGVPVTGGELIVHMRGGQVLAANGKAVDGLEGFEVIPTVASNEATNAARDWVTRTLKAPDAELSEPRLEVFNQGILNGRTFPTRLAWFVEARDLGLREYIWIDASLRIVLLHFSQLADAKNRAIYNGNNSSALPGTLMRSEGGAATGDADADRAYDFSGHTYDYFFTNHGRDSYNGAGAQLTSTVHHCPATASCPYGNAFWNGQQMVYGNGFSSADDVVAHELTHAVTEYSANLFYYMQSGALNESFSDIFGETVDLGNGAGNDAPGVRWQMGEDIGAIRNMMDPTLFLDPGKMSDAQFACETSPVGQDRGGVHSNSGVPNHAYALMVDGGVYNGITVAGIGITKAAKIQYRALTQYLISSSDFLDNYGAIQQSCADLVGTAGITSGNCAEVKKALDAVQMSNNWPCSALYGVNSGTPALCSAGQGAVNSFFDGFEAGLGNWAISGTPNTWSRTSTFWGSNAFATGGVDSLWGYDQAIQTDSIVALATNKVIPAGARLQFNHSFAFENTTLTNWDGGTVEYSTNGGANWTNLSALYLAGANYNGTILGGGGNPLGGQSAFVKDSFGYTASQYNLASLAGQTQVRFRFRIGTDSVGDDFGWFIDDFRIYTCVDIATMATPAPGSTLAGSSPTFTWNAAAGVSEYWLSVGTTVGGTQIYSATQGTNLSKTVAGLPTDGRAVHVRLWSLSGSTWLFNDYVYATSSVPTLTVNDVTVAEGNTGSSNATFTVSLAPAAGGTVTVAYATANGTAVAGSDYVTTTGTLTFTAGQATQTISVPINGDTTPEAAETFSVNLTSPTGGALIGDAQGVGTITNDDPLLICPASAPPGGAIAVQVFGGSSATDWLALYANSGIAPSGYLSWGYVPLPRPQTVNMTAPTTPGTYNIRLWPNNTATGMLGSCNVVVVLGPTLTVNDVTVAEGNTGSSNATFAVSLAPVAGGTVTVAYATANGTAVAGSDYVTTTGTLTFTAGQPTQTISVPINGDTTPEAAETFSVNLTSPTGGALIGDAQGVGTITNDDPLLICPASAPPGGAIAVQVFGGSSATDWLALYANSGIAPSGYLSWGYVPLPRPQTVNMTAPTTPGTYNIRLWPNNTATGMLGSCNVVVVLGPTLTVNDVTVAEGNTGSSNATFTVSLAPAAGGTVTVAYATANGTAVAGSDYVTTTGTLTFTAGQPTQTISVPINGDTTPEAAETFSVNLTSPTGGALIGDAQGVGTITNDDPLLICPASAPPGGAIAVQVFGGSSATDWLALYANSGIAPSGYLSWGYVPLPRPQTVNMTAPTTPGTYNIRLWPNNTATGMLGSCNVVVVLGPTLTVNDVTVAEGNTGSSNATFTVSLAPAAGGTVTVAYATANGTAVAGSDYVTTTGTLTFTAGQATQTISVPINGDTTPEAAETFSVNLTSPTGGALIGDAQGVGTITNDDPLLICPASAPPGGAIAVQVFGGSSATDWLALYANSGIAPSGYLSWGYVPLPRPQTVNMTAPTTPGTYNIRLWPNNTATGMLGSCNVVVVLGPTLTVNDVTVAEGNTGSSNATFTVSLAPAAGGTVTVAYATANGTAVAGSDYVTTTGTLTFTAGQPTQTISVPINGDTTPEAAETFSVNLTSPTGGALIGDAQGVGTITNDDPLLICPASAPPGGAIAVQVFGGSSATDWLALYANSGIAPSGYLSWGYVPLPRPQTVNMTAPATPGTYNIRLWPNNTATGMLGSCNVVVAAAPGCADADGDRLCDNVETNTGVYVSTSNTGTNPNNPDTDGDAMKDGDEVLGTLGGLNLPGMGTNPLKKNILLEYDWMDDSSPSGNPPLSCGAHSHRPTQAMLNRVTAAFAASSNTNPDGTTGIVVIHDFGQGGLFTGGNLIADADGIITGGVNGADFIAKKGPNFASNRNGYFHYVIDAHEYSDFPGSSGQAELPGDDLIVSLGCYDGTINTSNTIMHELGHNLNLQHGGNESCNWKPNYNSVMNYRFQFPGIDTSCNAVGSSGESGILDYSRGIRISLNENALNENLGTCGSTAIDWNFINGLETSISYDLNRTDTNPTASTGVDNGSCGGTLTTLNDYNDWSNIVFTGLADADGALLFPRRIVDCDNRPPAAARGLR